MTHYDTIFSFFLHLVLTAAGIGSTLFSLLYLRSPWYQTVLGKALLFQSIAMSTFLDLTVVFHYWDPPSYEIYQLINIVALLMLTIGTFAMMIVLVSYQKEGRHHKRNNP